MSSADLTGSDPWFFLDGAFQSPQPQKDGEVSAIGPEHLPPHVVPGGTSEPGKAPW